MENLMKISKFWKFQTTLKSDLDVVYICYKNENISKESQEHIFDNFINFCPFPADLGHWSHQQNSQN